MEPRQTFSAVLRDDGSFEIPFDVRAAYGEARPAVKMTLRGETYPTRVMVYRGKSVLGIWKAVLAKHALREGQTFEVTLEPDRDERTIKPPRELAAILAKDPRARAGWAAMSFTHQREWAQAIEGAKRPETRTRRVAQAVVALALRAKKAGKPPRKPARTSSRARTTGR
jgi:hypothetical protein